MNSTTSSTWIGTQVFATQIGGHAWHGLADQTSSQMDTHGQSHDINLQATRSSQAPDCYSQLPSRQCHVEVSRGQILRELQNASEADLSESLPQPLGQGSSDFLQSSRRFIPRSSLLHILNSRRVAEHLKTLLDDQQSPDQIADYICPGEGTTCRCGDGLCTGSRFIFASLVRIGKEDCIVHFYNRTRPGICDSSLPISNETLIPELTNELTEKEELLFKHAQSQLRFHYMRKLAPYDQNFRELDNEAALPYSHVDERTDPINGELSVVRHIRIDPNHHNLVSQFTTTINFSQLRADWQQ